MNVDTLWNIIQQNGLAFSLLGGIAWYFYNRTEKLAEDLRKSSDEIKQYYKNDNAEMRRVLEHSNEVMEHSNEVIKRNNEIFEEFLKKMDIRHL
jgi:Mg2+ and Co2+ transporter CorA